MNPASRRRAVPAASALLAALVLAAGTGCAGGRRGADAGGPRRSGADGVAEVHLFGLPVALDLDGRPGADAVGVRVYASDGARARGIPIRSGRLEIVMYDGAFDTPQLAGQAPLRTWTFGPSELAPLAGGTSLGTGYQLALRWAPARPTARAVTVIARYHSPKGDTLVSEPNSIPVR